MEPVSQTQAFGERLRSAVGAAGVHPSPTAVARAFNLRYRGRSISSHSVRNWLLGQALPTQDKLVVLADWLQVSPDELRFGKSASAARLSAAEARLELLDMADREMVRRYLSLPTAERKTVREVVAALALAASQKEKPIADDPQ